jgi:hypothetical protein
MAWALGSPLLTKKTAIRVKLETTKGTKITTDQYLFVSNLKTDPAADFIERPGTGLYRGHAARGVIGARKGKVSFDCELRGTGSGGCEAGLAILLQACGLKATSALIYSMHSTHTDDKTISIDVFQDGMNKCLIGASGTWKLGGNAGNRAVFSFEFQGIWQAAVDTALPAANPSTTLPLMMQGGTFTIATNAIKIDKFELDIGADVQPREDVAAVGGIAYFMTPDVMPMLSIDPEAQLVANYDFYGLWLAGTEAAVSAVFKNATDQLTIAIPAFQIRELPEGERTGKLIHDMTGQCNHSSGNDGVTLTFAAAA